MLLPLQGVIRFVINYSQGDTLGWVLVGLSGRCLYSIHPPKTLPLGWILVNPSDRCFVFYSSTQDVAVGLNTR